MMHAHSYLRSALSILDAYNGNIPFAAWLRDHFRQNKKFGSRDRKWISHLCYSFFRTGKGFEGRTMEEKVIAGLFLSTSKNDLLQGLDPALNEKASLSLNDKIGELGIADWQPVSGLEEEFSKEVDVDAFAQSLYIQPDLYIRVRPGYEDAVKKKLADAGIQFSEPGENCIALPNSTKIDELLLIDKEIVIQDSNSQRVLDDFFTHYTGNELHAWDCCAASGGKSLLLYDRFPGVKLTATDIRESIIHNLQRRFVRAGITSYESGVMDVGSEDFRLDKQFDLVICDAPCTGSGTWSRTPEQLFFFKKSAIEKYSSLQKSIALNAAKQVKPGGYFCYITCSVFRNENEEAVDHLTQNTNLELVSSRFHAGYEKKADTLYSALLRKS